ncbi:MAG: hypothetical protein K2X49_23545 [Acetobacteraceae bacterium]|nr:hypothetical protein [Acetobacteraceae bacterium]
MAAQQTQTSTEVPAPTAGSNRGNYSFEKYDFNLNAGIPERHARDLPIFFQNFHLDPTSLDPQTVLLARRFFQRHVVNIAYFDRLVRWGRWQFAGIILLAALVALLAPLAVHFIPSELKHEPVAVVAVLSAAVAGVVAVWKLLQSQWLAGLRMDEWRTIARKLRNDLYRIEGKRRASVEAKQRAAKATLAEVDKALAETPETKKALWRNLSAEVRSKLINPTLDEEKDWDALQTLFKTEADAILRAPGAVTKEEEASLRDEFQAAITAAETILEEEITAQFKVIYDTSRLTQIAESIPTALTTVQQKLSTFHDARTNDAKQRGEEVAADRKLERLERIRAERVKEYKSALDEEIKLTADKKPWDGGDAKPNKPDDLAALIAQKKLRERLLEEIDAIDTEWKELRKLQRNRTA